MNYYIRAVVSFLIITLYCNNALSSDESKPSLSSLIKQFEVENDLSKETKQESLGHVAIFTRQDINEFNIDTIQDLILKLPLIRYTETHNGLMDPGYVQKDKAYESLMKVYIDNQPLSMPYQGTGVKYYSKINLSFADHIEVYWGFPSFTLGVNVAAIVVKIYSKKPSRENITTLGAKVSNNGSFDIYGYSAHELDDFSYLLSLNQTKLKQKKVYAFDGYPLSKNQETSNIFASFIKGKSSISINALKGQYDGFIGESIHLKPIKNAINAKHMYLNYNYGNKDDLQISLGYAYTHTDTYNKVVPTPSWHPIPHYLLMPTHFPDSQLNKAPTKDLGLYERELREQQINANITKHLNCKNNSLTFGYRGQYKQFKFNKYIASGVEVDSDAFNYNKELTSSLFAEDTYMLNDKNLVIGSFMYSYYNRDKNVANKKSLNGRLGYIYNNNNWYNKFFVHYGENNSDSYLFSNYFWSKQPKRTHEKIVSNELGYKFNNKRCNASLMVGYAKAQDKEPNESSTHKIAILNLNYQINNDNYLKGSYWYIQSKWQSDLPTKIQMMLNNENPFITNRHGGYVSLNSSFKMLSITNTLRYFRDTGIDHNYIGYDIRLKYTPNKNLTLSLKGMNLFNSDFQGSFYGISSESPALVKFKTNYFDRAIWFGMEYSF